MSAFINPTISAFPAYTQKAGVRGYAARLAASSPESLVLVGLSSIFPSVRLSADGSTLTMGITVMPTGTNALAQAPGVKVVVADFNGDAVSDYAFVGGVQNPQPKYLPFVLSNGLSTYTSAFLPIADLAASGKASQFALPLRRQGTTANELGLLKTIGGITLAQLRP